MLREGLRQALAGITLGALLGLLGVRGVAARLPRIQAVDPAALAAAAGVLVLSLGFRVARDAR